MSASHGDFNDKVQLVVGGLLAATVGIAALVVLVMAVSFGIWLINHG